MKIASIQVYLRPIMLKIFGLGFASGLPLALTASTMQAYLQDRGVSLSSIGVFTLLSMPYTLKFMWAPLLDQMRLPYLTSMLGRRKSLILILQMLLIVSIYHMGLVDAEKSLFLFAILALITAFLSASHDVVIDTLRIEMLSEDEQGLGAAVSIFGYRIGMLASGAGALYISHYYGWYKAYSTMSAMMLIGVIAVFSCREKEYHAKELKSFSVWMQHAFIQPLSEFVKRDGWVGIMLFVMFFKMSDAFAGAMTTPFLMDIGFDKKEIANIVKVFGFVATLLGSFVGGIIVKSFGYYKSLFWGAILQMLSNLAFVWQAIAGHDSVVLMTSISIENFTSGISSIALVAYISHICNREFTATQYAFFSAMATMARTTLSATSGDMAENLGWIAFFIVSSMLTLPSLYFLKYALKKGE